MNRINPDRESPGNLLVRSGIPAPEEIERQLEKRLSERLESSVHYGREEIQRIAATDPALFPSDFDLPPETADSFRALAKLSQCSLKPLPARSHRRIIGPVIVSVKNLLWRFVRPPLEDAFNGMQEFCSWMVFAHARQTIEIQRLKSQLSAENPEKRGS